ncbi:glutamate formimidoyltransferase [Mucilaginibacter auburnensis]|uniref:glutamate formimidoyltransferase n=1 Tax=Mucilaginibacter auburnensis TaxID=1457233 RepID=A0A2H9VT62_9SPHI|nr:glutamate formimidoyltransferase [Mucilaginibacter auburnensis]PJJ83999.1 glutamate formiminotransferase/formiminotetrahydrofolate cyclodeaminase [Mucilaginibacter auburnensis]
MKQIIECVPNFSEGIDQDKIDRIAAGITEVFGVKLLNIDPGHDANRTVITFAGEPHAVVEAAFNAIKIAGEVIDMRSQKGEHPRMGATDVCPLIPVSNITLTEVDAYAKQLAARVGQELGIPVYLYEHSQADKKRSNLSIIRSGEYEGFFEKIKQAGWQPDYGPLQMDAKRGATVIGARNFLIAYNVNLSTVSVDVAAEIAADVRESGRLVLDGNGAKQRVPGLLKGVKAIGWYMKEYSCAQVSTNITDMELAPIHKVFETVVKCAEAHGIKVTGSELIGLIPLSAVLAAGRYYADKGGLTIMNEDQLVDAAVDGLGLAALKRFEPQKRILDYLLSELNK